MPKNKNASFRYRVINECLRNTGRNWTLEDLVEKISEELYEHFGITKGISKRTVQYDINTMRSLPPRGFDAPIICKDGFYYYEDPDFSINQNPLNETDIENLQEAVDILRHFKGLPIYSEIENIIGKMQYDIVSSQKDQSIDFENVSELTNIDLIGEIYPYVKERKVLDIQYKPFSKTEPIVIRLHPYLLKEYNNRWFLIGWNQEYEDFSVLAIDRIQHVTEINVPFIENHKDDMLTLLNNIIGVSIPATRESEKIEIEVFSPSIPYLLTKPLHTSQTLKTKKKNSAIFMLHLIPNFELEQKILSFGENCKVLKPEYFQTRLKERIEKLNERYK